MDNLRLLKTKSAGRIWATEEGEALLASLGLTTAPEVAGFAGGEVVTAGTHRTVRRLTGGDGRIYFLKQTLRSARGTLLPGFVRKGKRTSSLRIEADNLDNVARAGIHTPRVVAVGEVIRGFSEESSFLLTDAVPGHDLSLYLAGGHPDLPRTEACDRLVVEAVTRACAALLEHGLYFADFVPKHIFLDRKAAEDVVLSLIDVARLRVGVPGDEEEAAGMLAKLNASVPFAALSTGRRGRFLRNLTDLASGPPLSLVARRTADLLIKRRHRFVLSPRPRPIEPTVHHAPDGALAWTAEGQTLVNRFSPPATAPANCPAAEPGFEVTQGLPTEIRLMVNLQHQLLGWVDVEPLVVWSDREGAAWACRRSRHAERFAEVAATADDDQLKHMGAELGRAVRALLAVGVLPAADWADWLRWGEGEMLFTPYPPFTVRDLKADKAEEDLFCSLGRLINGRRLDLIRSEFSLEVYGLLGQRLGRNPYGR